jgi:SAM-dependent methyltransferase
MNPINDSQLFWNEKYSGDSFIYGQNPNAFFKIELDDLNPGTLLLPAEGEGRNAVYAARKGWEVEAFDLSTNGRNKAHALAKHYDVSIKYKISGYREFDVVSGTYDAIGLIYAHMHEDTRRQMHRKLIEGLKPGGKLILEAFAKEQIHNASGGPKDEAMLYSREELAEDFKTLHIQKLEKCDTTINEGPHHQGNATVIRLTAQKPY